MPVGLIRSRVEKLAHEIVDSLVKQNVTEVYMVGIMTGAYQFHGDLIEFMNPLVARTTPRIHLHQFFVKASSYLGTKAAGPVKLGDLPDYTGKHVIIVEDMVDSGGTMKKLYDKISKPKEEDGCNAKKVESAIAFYKKIPKNLKTGYMSEYIAFFVPKGF